MRDKALSCFSRRFGLPRYTSIPPSEGIYFFMRRQQCNSADTRNFQRPRDDTYAVGFSIPPQSEELTVTPLFHCRLDDLVCRLVCWLDDLLAEQNEDFRNHLWTIDEQNDLHIPPLPRDQCLRNCTCRASPFSDACELTRADWRRSGDSPRGNAHRLPSCGSRYHRVSGRRTPALPTSAHTRTVAKVPDERHPSTDAHNAKPW